MENEDISLFSTTEEILFEKIKRAYNSINRHLEEDGEPSSGLSTISLSEDGLDAVSDVSSVASFVMSKKKPEFHTPQRRKSRIPIFSNRPQSERKKPKCQHQENMQKRPLRVYQERPQNFLIPDISKFSRVCVCIFEGADFPMGQNGERNTYVIVQLHPDIIPIKTPISFNRTKNAIYNGGYDVNCSGLDFTSVVPFVSVYDFINENETELIGVAFVELHLAKAVDDMCIVVRDEWVDIFAVNRKTKTGRIRMTLIFHNDGDISDFVRKPSFSDSEKNITDSEDVPIKLTNSFKDYMVSNNNKNNNNNNSNNNNNKLKRVDQGIQGDEFRPKLKSLGIQAELENTNANDESINLFGELSMTSKNMDMKLNNNSSEQSSPDSELDLSVPQTEFHKKDYLIRNKGKERFSTPPKKEKIRPSHVFADETALSTFGSLISSSESENDDDDETFNELQINGPVGKERNKRFVGYSNYDFIKKK